MLPFNVVVAARYCARDPATVGTPEGCAGTSTPDAVPERAAPLRVFRNGSRGEGSNGVRVPLRLAQPCGHGACARTAETASRERTDTPRRRPLLAEVSMAAQRLNLNSPVSAPRTAPAFALFAIT